MSQVPSQGQASPQAVSVLEHSEQWRLMSKVLPQPSFDGDASNWAGFKRKWNLWYKFQKLDKEWEDVVLTNSLPAKDGPDR